MDISSKKKFFVIGLGKSGVAVTRLLANRGFNVAIFDDDASVLESVLASPEFEGLERSVEIATGESVLGSVIDSDCVVVSPGVSLEHPVVRKARADGIEVIGELELAYHFCAAEIIGVTGTNGKSTVVSLLGDIFQAAERRYAVGGNIGTPLSSIITQKREIDVAVLEISSFQLDTIEDFKTRVAVLLNVTADHLDRYDNSFDKYAESKSRILNAADEDTWFVYNEDDVVCKRIADGYTGKKIPFGRTPAGDNGVYVHEGTIVRRWRGDVEVVMPISDFSPVGIHNLENAMAAVAAAMPFDIDARVVARALRAYRALPHRMELARVAGGVAYIDDSKATNVDAAIKSVRSIDGHLVLILGGVDKGGDYAPLVKHLGKVRRVVLIGEAGDKIEAALRGHCDIFRAATMEEAVRVASETAKSGDTVLLAPACSSFDMFSGYTERGEAFKAAASLL